METKIKINERKIRNRFSRPDMLRMAVLKFGCYNLESVIASGFTVRAWSGQENSIR